ncbi:MAG: lipoyl synthase [Polyangia bacterium]|jgi:lipoic acid synthetase|nr:lipoyl synthase [Polyangia bacterium]
MDDPKVPASKRAKRQPRPEWLRVKLPGGPEYAELRRTLGRLGLHTVCVEAACPNLGECWSRRSMTLMILGDRCTRQCRFCNVSHLEAGPPDPEEPRQVARALAGLPLRHAVITSVTRDDLPDKGAAHWAATIREVRAACPGLTIEALTPDFQGDLEALELVLEARPAVFAHNLETVRRLTPRVRSHASYDRSLDVLGYAGARGALTKSGLMAGLGETRDELVEALGDLRRAGVKLVTIGQYLQPSRRHLAVAEYLPPEAFDALRVQALELGFVHVASGPLVRSSYHADEGAALAGAGPSLAGAGPSLAGAGAATGGAGETHEGRKNA